MFCFNSDDPNCFQPELNAIKKELNLLQRLYKLYNDVIDRFSLHKMFS